MSLGITQPITTDVYPEGSVGARALGVTHKLSARGKSQGGTTGADVDFSNLVNDLDKLKADVYNSISGLNARTSGIDIDHDIIIDPGACADSTNAVSMILEAALRKRIDANWAVGDGNGGFPSALTLSNTTWYHFFLILKIDVEAGTYVVDAGFDTSLSATNLLSDATGYTHFRRIRSVLTDGSANIVRATTEVMAGGDLRVVWYTLPTLDKNAAVATGARETIGLTVPTGYEVKAIINAYVTAGSGGAVYFTELAQADQAVSTTAAPLGQIAWASLSDVGGSPVEIITNTSGQIGARGNTAGVLRIATYGWIDSRQS